MDITLIAVVVQLIFLEGILSIDNAAVLGAMVLPLPIDKPIPWPRWLRWIGDHGHRLLGNQREAALRIGLFGAYAGRALMLFLAALVIQNTWLRVLGALYLLYLALEHFAEKYHPNAHEEEGIPRRSKRSRGFWATVAATILADLTFSIDNVIAAVSLSEDLMIVLLGVGIGMIIMRFAASLFSRVIAWEPAMASAAYLLLVAVGVELLFDVVAGIEISEITQFSVAIAILGLTILVARTPLCYHVWRLSQPLLAVLAGLQWVIDGVLGLLTAPFRRAKAVEAKTEVD